MRLTIPRLPYREDSAFALLLLQSLVVPLAFDFYLYEKFETIKLALWAVILAFTIIAFFVKNKVFTLNKYLTGLSFALVGFAVLSTIFSIGHINSIFGFYPRFTSGLLFYLLWLATLLMFFAVLNREKWEILARVIFFDAVLIAVVGLMQSFGIGYYEGVEQSFITRAPSLLGNPNFSSMFLAAAALFAFPLVIYAKNFKTRLYYCLGTFIIVSAVAVFSSRGAILGFVAGLLVLVALNIASNFSKKTAAFSLIISGLIFCLVLGFVEVSRPGSIKSALKLSEVNVDTRLFSWDVARQAITKYPYFGLGPGNLQIYFEKNRPSNLAASGGVFDDAHNLFLQMAATTGLPFGLCFIVLMGYGFWRGYMQLKADEASFWTRSLLAALVSWLVAACFNPVSSANFYLLCLILAGLFLTAESRVEISIPKIFKYLIFAISTVVIIISTAFFIAECFFYKGYISYQNYEYEKSHKYLKIAEFLNPTNQLYFLYEAADQIILRPDNSLLEKQINYILKLQPQMAKSQVMAANLSYLMYDRTQDAKYLKQAIAYMDKSLVMDKYSAPRYGHQAFYLAEDGQLSLAREYAKTGLAFDPKNLPTWLLLARIFQLENKLPQTQYALNEIFKLKPDDAYLKRLNEQAKSVRDLKELNIPAVINIFQIEP